MAVGIVSPWLLTLGKIGPKIGKIGPKMSKKMVFQWAKNGSAVSEIHATKQW